MAAALSMSRIVIRNQRTSQLWGYSGSVSQHAALPLIKSTERVEWKHKKETRTTSWCFYFISHIVSYSSFNLWCFSIIVIKEDVDSDAASFYPTFDLGCNIKADNGRGEEQLIGICWAWQLLTWMPKCYRAGEHSIRSVAKIHYMFLFNLIQISCFMFF